MELEQLGKRRRDDGEELWKEDAAEVRGQGEGGRPSINEVLPLLRRRDGGTVLFSTDRRGCTFLCEIASLWPAASGRVIIKHVMYLQSRVSYLVISWSVRNFTVQE